MIRVIRPAAGPPVLTTTGASATATLIAGGPPATFDRSIYAHDSVKTSLRDAQYDKCCFCESKVSHISHGDVEHFRPKSAWRQRKGGPLQRPGYYWLAYEWTNLFFCCQVCNQRHKENLFPLRRARSRVTSPGISLASEEPLFVNPEEDPSRHIRFRKEFAYPHRNSRRGKATIDGLGLNRPFLAERRLEALTKVRQLRDCLEVFQRDIQNAVKAGRPIPAAHQTQVNAIKALFAGMTADTAEYAAMVRAAIA